MRLSHSCRFLTCLLLVHTGPCASAQLGSGGLKPGDILIADYYSLDGNGRLFWVNPANGQRLVVSDFNNPTQGPATAGPYGVAVPDRNTILVVDSTGTSGLGALIQVDPATGMRTHLSDFGNVNQGPLGVLPIMVAVIGGQTLVIDRDGGTAERGSLIRVNRVTGQRTLVSDFGNPAQGALGENPHQISRGHGGTILVVDADAGTNRLGAVFRIDPSTGVRTIVSDFGDPAQGPIGNNPGGVTQGAAGVLLITDTAAGTGGSGLLFAVNPQTGQRTILSDFGDLTKGATGIDPFHLAVGTNGAILVVDAEGGTDVPNDDLPGGNGALFAVDRTTGFRTLLSDFGNVTQGQLGANPSGIAIVPLVQPGDALLGAQSPAFPGAGLVGVNSTTGERYFVSNFGQPHQGPTAQNIYDVAIGTDGDILAIDSTSHFLFVVDPTSGVRTLVSNLANAAQGPTGIQPRSVTLGLDGNILVGVTSPVGVLSVNPATGMRTLLHSLGNAALGPVGDLPEDLEPKLDNELLVLDSDAVSLVSGTSRGMLFNVNLATGLRTVISDFGNPAHGTVGVDPCGLVREADGQFLVSDTGGSPTLSRGAISRLNLATGVRTVLSDLGNSAQGPGVLSKEVALEDNGAILILDTSFDNFGRGALLRADPVSGLRTLVSSFRDTTKGAEINTVSGLAVFPSPPAAPGGPTAVDGSLATSEDHSAGGTLTASDPNNAALVFSIVSNGAIGTAVVDDPATGAFTYTPAANAFGSDSFTFMANNGVLDSNLATIQVTISPVNDAPVAASDMFTVAAGASRSGTLVGSDVENDALTFSIETVPSQGTVVLTDSTTGDYTYTANAGPGTIDSFTFKVNDGALDSNIASIAINITGNEPPVASNATFSTSEDKAVSGALNASDPERAKLTYALVSTGLKGTATITNPSTGRFTYVPQPNLFGNDEFTFRASDGVSQSNVATVLVSIIPVNDAPVATDMTVNIMVNTPVTDQLSASDVDDDVLTFAMGKGRGPRRGTVSISPSGQFTYTPATGFTGTDSFNFQVSDGIATDSGTVTVNVLAP